MSAIGTKRTSLVARTCPLLGVKRTWRGHTRMSANGPGRTCVARNEESASNAACSFLGDLLTAIVHQPAEQLQGRKYG
jgi:hypothetical protein